MIKLTLSYSFGLWGVFWGRMNQTQHITANRWFDLFSNKPTYLQLYTTSEKNN